MSPLYLLSSLLGTASLNGSASGARLSKSKVFWSSVGTLNILVGAEGTSELDLTSILMKLGGGVNNLITVEVASLYINMHARCLGKY